MRSPLQTNRQYESCSFRELDLSEFSSLVDELKIRRIVCPLTERQVMDDVEKGIFGLKQDSVVLSSSLGSNDFFFDHSNQQLNKMLIEKLFLVLGIFCLTMLSVSSLSCISSPDWRLCQPDVLEQEPNCR